MSARPFVSHLPMVLVESTCSVLGGEGNDLDVGAVGFGEGSEDRR